jgi:hypothetical protein
MNKAIVGMLGGLALMAGSVYAWQTGVVGKYDNMLSTRLDGKWALDRELTARLDPDRPGMLPAIMEFRRDDRIVAQLRVLSERFKSPRIYMGGMMWIDDMQHPFIVENESGDSHLVILTPTRDDPAAVYMTTYICMAASRDAKTDLLFIGGDRPNESAAAFERIAK